MDLFNAYEIRRWSPPKGEAMGYANDFYDGLEGGLDEYKARKGKEKENMAMIGRISKKRVDNYAWGEKVTFLVNGKWISAMVNKNNPPSEEMMGLLKNLQEGDEAQFEITESPNKTDPSKPPYLNITDIVKVTRVGGDTGGEMDYHTVAPGEKKVQPDGHKDSRELMMMRSYCKDIMIAFPNEGEAELLGRVIIVKKMADLMGE